MKTKIETPRAPSAIGPYSQGIVNGNLIFTAGQIYMTTDGKLIEGTVEEKVHRVMKNLEEVLKSGGVTFADVVKATVYITDFSIFDQFNKVYSNYMKEPFPARETVCVKELPKGAIIEISMIAVK